MTSPVNFTDPTGHKAMHNPGGGSSVVVVPEPEPHPVEKFVEFAINEGKLSQDEYDNGIPTDNSNRRVESGRDTDDTMYNYFYHMVTYDWCGYFTVYCAEQIGIYGVARASTYKLNAETPEYRKREASDGYRPYSGDIFYYFTDADGNGKRDSNTRSHIGIVIGSDEKYFYTVEGNVNSRVMFVRRLYNNVDNLHFASNNIGLHNIVDLNDLDFIDDPRSTN